MQWLKWFNKKIDCVIEGGSKGLMFFVKINFSHNNLVFDWIFTQLRFFHKNAVCFGSPTVTRFIATTYGSAFRCWNLFATRFYTGSTSTLIATLINNSKIRKTKVIFKEHILSSRVEFVFALFCIWIYFLRPAKIY